MVRQVEKKTTHSRIFLLFLPILSSALLFGCAVLKDTLGEPGVEFSRIDFENMTLVGGTVVFEFKVTNPYPVPLNLDRLTYSLTIDDAPLTNGDLKQGLRIDAGGSRQVRLPIAVNYLDLFTSISEFLNKDSVRYTIAGDFEFGAVSIPYQKKGAFDIPVLPDIHIRKIDITRMSLTGASLKVLLAVRNQNDFKLVLDSMDFLIKLDGVTVGSGNIDSIPQVAPDSDATLEIPLDINFLTLGRSVYRLLSQQALDYQISGKMGVGPDSATARRIPYETGGTVDISGTANSGAK